MCSYKWSFELSSMMFWLVTIHTADKGRITSLLIPGWSNIKYKRKKILEIAVVKNAHIARMA